jgi:hypothetical protein
VPALDSTRSTSALTSADGESHHCRCSHRTVNRSAGDIVFVPMTTSRCQDCGKPFGMARRPVRTATGREVCAACRDRITAAAAGGVMANPDTPVAGTIATEGWFRRLRRRGRSK